VDGRVGVEGSDEDLDLRIDTFLLVCISADDREGSDTFTVETLPRTLDCLDPEELEMLPCSWRKTEQGMGCGPARQNV
jgi:hypothetical protein